MKLYDMLYLEALRNHQVISFNKVFGGLSGRSYARVVGFLTLLPVHLRFSLCYKRMPVLFHNLKAQTQKATPCLYVVRKVCISVEEFVS